LGEFHLSFSSALPHPGTPFIFLTGSSILISTLSLFFFYLTSSSNHWRRSFFPPAFFPLLHRVERHQAGAGGTGGAHGGGSAGTARASVRGACAAPERARRAGGRAARERVCRATARGWSGWLAAAAGRARGGAAPERARGSGRPQRARIGAMRVTARRIQATWRRRRERAPSGGCGAWGGAERLGWREPERRVDVGRWRAGGRRRQCAARVSVREQS
jgi:hypothetical protein